MAIAVIIVCVICYFISSCPCCDSPSDSTTTESSTVGVTGVLFSFYDGVRQRVRQVALFNFTGYGPISEDPPRGNTVE